MNETVSPLASRCDQAATSEEKGMQVNDRQPSVHAPTRRIGFVAAATLAALCMVFVSSAGAGQMRPFKETFGSAVQPSFGSAGSIAVDASGDILVIDSAAATISRYNADGTAADFSALGSNILDAAEGPGGKPCAEEPASCDRTPDDGFLFHTPSETQIAVDRSGGVTEGNIYVTQNTRDLVDVFGSDGAYLGQLTEAESSFGEPCGVAAGPDGAVYVGDYGRGEIHKFVPSGSAPTNSDFTASFRFPGSPCTVAAGSGPSAGSIFPAQYNGPIYKMSAVTGEVEYQVSSAQTTTETVDPISGHLLVARFAGAVEYDVSGSEEATVASRLGTTDPTNGIAIDGSDEVYVSRAANLDVFGPAVPLPAVTATAATEVTGSKATLNGIVNPEGAEVEECFFEWGETFSYGNVAPCEGAIPTDSEDHAVHADLSGLDGNGTVYHYRLVAKNENGTELSSDQTVATAATATTQAATNVGLEGATLNGVVRPEGQPITDCVFEYGLTTTSGYEASVPCDPVAAAIPADFTVHAVSAGLTGLARGATYKFRLVTTNADGSVPGAKLTFETQGAPRILLTQASEADQDSATLEARINPNGFATTYRFEWGPTASYGNSAPASFEPVGSGTAPVIVRAEISGLSAASVYHYKVTAESAAGTVETTDQLVETVNSCGLPEGRCFELTSRREAGPVAIPGKFSGSIEMHYQAAPSPGSLAYVVETGYQDATKGAEVVYRADRRDDGWLSTQLSPSITARNEGNTESSASSQLQVMSEDLTCGVTSSNQPLTADPGTRLADETGGANLYRRNPDGSYTAITDIPPANPEVGTGVPFAFVVYGTSPDCGVVVFGTPYRYPGVPAVGFELLYEWREGTLRGLGSVPGPGGEEAVEASAGTENNHSNIVSEDGSRIFFSAARQASENPEEIGTTGVFVRENGVSTRDLSLSETSIPDEGAKFQYASKDGSRVFFTANAGLTDISSQGGTDLYEYNLESDELNDLSIAEGDETADVVGFIGASDDGAHAYFIARGQLVPGRGRSHEENEASNTYAIYGVDEGQIEYVGLVRKGYPRIADQGFEFEEGQWEQQTVGFGTLQTARVTPDGRFLTFESSVESNGYDSGNGILEAFLYDSARRVAECISCRQDDQTSVSPPRNTRFRRAEGLVPIRYLAVRDGQPRVVFSSFDALAPGAAEGRANLYAWSHGQVFLIATEPPGLQPPLEERGVPELVQLIGANADGTDLYFATTETLTWEDGDERSSIYDARIGGGFPEPLPAPVPCDPGDEGSCQGSPDLAPAAPAPGSSTFVGPSNPKPKKAHKKKHHKKKNHKGKHHKKKQNANRRAGK